MNRRLLILIGVAVVLGGIYAATQMGGSGNTVRAIAPGGMTGGATGAEAIVRTPPIAQEEGPFLPPVTAFSAIGNRPLFRPDRRPPATPVIETPVQTPVETPVNDRPPDIVVVSVVSGPNGRSAATVRENGETRRVYTGDTISGWRVDAINANGLEISSGRERWALPVGEPDE